MEGNRNSKYNNRENGMKSKKKKKKITTSCVSVENVEKQDAVHLPARSENARKR